MPIFGLRPTKPTTASQLQQYRGIEDAQHQLVLDLAGGLVRGEHVVEVTELRQPDSCAAHRALDACGSRGE